MFMDVFAYRLAKATNELPGGIKKKKHPLEAKEKPFFPRLDIFVDFPEISITKSYQSYA